MVSVILPVYNVAKYLNEGVRSVLAQSHRDLEVILIDDGSTDGSGDMCDALCATDSRIRVIHTENRGQSAARNSALDIARGEWITFVDPDDTVSPEYVKSLLDAATSSRADIAACPFVYLDKAPEIRPRHTVPAVFDSESFLKMTLYQTHSTNTCVWSKIFRRDIFADERFEPGVIYEDFDILFRILRKKYRVATISVPLYHYRMRHDSSMHSPDRSRLNVLRVTEHIEQWARENRPALLPAARDRRFAAACNMYMIMADLLPEPEMKQIWEIIRSHRLASLSGLHVRIKNRAGALLSLLGPKTFLKFRKLYYGV